MEGNETGWLPEEKPDLQRVEFKGHFDERAATALQTRLDWPLMKHNMTRDDLDAVVCSLVESR